jgi:hypothetical protein
MLNEIIKLEIKGFLNTENGRTLIQNHGASRVTTILPDMVSVFGGTVTDIEGHDGKRFNRSLAAILTREE